MSLKVQLRVVPGGGMVAANDDSFGDLQKFKAGELLNCEITRMRNPKFHRKYFALIDTAFNWWNPPAVEFKGQEIAKDKETFRENVQILAGFGYPVADIRGNVHYRSKSISFGSMEQEEFERLYSAVLDVVLDKVLDRSYEQRLKEAVDAVMAFA